jgi:hypothetical protein
VFTPFNSFWIRRLIALARSTVEKTPEQAQGWPDFFDNTEGIGGVQRTLFYKDKRSGIMLPYKGTPKPVDVTRKIGVEAHITAVAFGTTKRARAFWKKQLLSGVIPVGLLNGDLLYNNQITRYTYHGNGGNGPLVGVSAEANLPGLERWPADKRPRKYHDLDEHFILTNRATVRLAVTHSRDLGAPIEALYAHRQYSGGRLGDPGEGWWKEIGIPLSVELNLERRVTFKHGSGNEICREWDEELGLVDYRGRRIAA